MDLFFKEIGGSTYIWLILTNPGKCTICGRDTTEIVDKPYNIC